MMNKPTIESTDRGVTLNKSLAWSVATGLIGAGVYCGLTIASLNTKMDHAILSMTTATVERTELDRRLRVVETAFARSDQQLLEVMRILTRIEARLDTLTDRRSGEDAFGGGR